MLDVRGIRDWVDLDIPSGGRVWRRCVEHTRRDLGVTLSLEEFDDLQITGPVLFEVERWEEGFGVDPDPHELPIILKPGPGLGYELELGCALNMGLLRECCQLGEVRVVDQALGGSVDRDFVVIEEPVLIASE